jgi:hypothetical protein
VARHEPTDEDRRAVISVTLSRIAADIELGEIADELAPLHPRINTFPAEVLLDLAAHAIEESGSTRDDPIETETIRQRLLPEDRAHTAAQHRKAEFSIRAAAMVASTSSSARAFFAQLRLPRKVWQTWRRFPVTGSPPGLDDQRPHVRGTLTHPRSRSQPAMQTGLPGEMLDFGWNVGLSFARGLGIGRKPRSSGRPRQDSNLRPSD